MDLSSLWTPLALSIFFFCHVTEGQQYGQVEFRIKEQMPSGTNVGSILEKAKIREKVSPRELYNLSFKFLNPNELLQTAALFSINSDNGAVYTTAMIDRESVCQLQKDCNVEFEVTVMSTSATSKFFEIVAVRIVIEDINDNAPRFPNNEVTLFISESVNVNSEFRIAGATDADKDEENSVRKYEMRSEYNDMFELKSEMKLDGTWDLSIVILQALDRENKDHYILYIIAKDNGTPQRSGNVTVHINVTDTNDNSPIFSENLYDVSVPEQAEVGAVVGQVTATDADSGMNAAITYKFSAARSSRMDDLFYIDSQSGEIKVKTELQYEAGKSFETIVVASDRGNPPRASQAVLILNILDVGNTPPRISINPVPNPDGNVLFISEASPLETVVAHVRTDDRDQGPNGIVDCRSISPQFKVRRFEGMGFLVEINRQLDREKTEELNVTIACEDRGTPKLPAYGWFIIKLVDANDNDPIFTKQIYRANLTENNRKGEHVLFVKAYDRDVGENAKLHYSISMESSESSFVIDNLTGEIMAGEEFDRETVSQVSFMVMAVDGGKRSGVASVVVDINDQNDNSPYFTSSMEFQIAEKLPASSKVDTLSANDRDAGRNADVVFMMPGENFNNPENSVPFVVMNNGVIRTATILDKDKKALYKFPVVVKDGGQPPRSSSATVTVRVIDSNDHRPVFTFPVKGNNTVRVRSDSVPGTTVAKLRATDEDIGRNARLKYYISSGNHDKAFTLPYPSTGEIMLTKDLTTIQSSVIRLNVSVRDQGIPMLEAHEVVVIQVDYVDGHGMGRAGGGGGVGGGKNATSMFGEDDIKYIIIAGVVGGVTVVISIIIVTIILRIRRPDNNNRNVPVSGVQEQGDGRHFDKQLWQSVPVDDLTPTDTEEKKIGSKSLKGGGGVSGGGGLDPKAKNGGFSPNNDLIDPYSRKHGGETFQTQPQLYTFKKCALRPPVDDHQSDTSGETTTSDSGRGGSEEDIQLPPLPELCEDTSRIIFKNPGAGLKDSRFVQSDYPDYGNREVIAFETFSPRTLPGANEHREKSTPYSGREVQTIGHSSRPFTDKTRHNRQGHYGSTPQSQTGYHPSPPSQQQYPHPPPNSGPGHYPEDIPETRGDSGLSKKVTFQTDLTTQNLKTWDLCQKMNLQKDTASRGPTGYHGNTSSQRGSYNSRPRSQDDDDNTTTSGSYTINPENDFDDILATPYSLA